MLLDNSTMENPRITGLGNTKYVHVGENQKAGGARFRQSHPEFHVVMHSF